MLEVLNLANSCYMRNFWASLESSAAGLQELLFFNVLCDVCRRMIADECPSGEMLAHVRRFSCGLQNENWSCFSGSMSSWAKGKEIGAELRKFNASTI